MLSICPQSYPQSRVHAAMETLHTPEQNRMDMKPKALQFTMEKRLYCKTPTFLSMFFTQKTNAFLQTSCSYNRWAMTLSIKLQFSHHETSPQNMF